jgi:hypothetical protein
MVIWELRAFDSIHSCLSSHHDARRSSQHIPDTSYDLIGIFTKSTMWPRTLGIVSRGLPPVTAHGIASFTAPGRLGTTNSVVTAMKGGKPTVVPGEKRKRMGRGIGGHSLSHVDTDPTCRRVMRANVCFLSLMC